MKPNQEFPNLSVKKAAGFCDLNCFLPLRLRPSRGFELLLAGSGVPMVDKACSWQPHFIGLARRITSLAVADAANLGAGPATAYAQVVAQAMQTRFDHIISKPWRAAQIVGWLNRLAGPCPRRKAPNAWRRSHVSSCQRCSPPD